VANRLLIINHLAGNSTLKSLNEEASDIVLMQQALQYISETSAKPISLETNVIDAGDAGTVMRFLLALLAVTPGNWQLTGTARMCERPVAQLVEALQVIGADICYAEKPGYPPLKITGKNELKGGSVIIDASISSQFVSALMMIAPAMANNLEIKLLGEVVSQPYIGLTEALMRNFGAEVKVSENKIDIKTSRYERIAVNDFLEADWSAAAFWFELAALQPDADIILKGLNLKSPQGDRVCVDIFKHLGVSALQANDGVRIISDSRKRKRVFDYDFTHCPDLAQPVIVTCAALGVKGTFSGLKTLRIKETDRVQAIVSELLKLGYDARISDNVITLNGNFTSRQMDQVQTIETYNDHRMAMSFAPLSVLYPNIAINEPEVVKKSYPAFWQHLKMSGFTLSEV
jgi:3-phosphoshikimate 1-carboxyvinyltransferase